MTTFGLELEFGDLDNSKDLPVQLGFNEGLKLDGLWRGAECGILNSNRKAVDCLRLTETRGGELATQPSVDVLDLFYKYLMILDFYRDLSVSALSAGQLSVSFNRKLSVDEFKKIFEYVKLNERYYWSLCVEGNLQEDLEYFSQVSSINHLINPKLYEAVKQANTFEDIETAVRSIHAIDAITKQETKSFRTVINLYGLVTTGRLEFRGFRETLDPYEKYSFIMLCYRLVDCMMSVGTGKSIKNILKEANYRLPKLRNIRQDVADYLATKPADRFTMSFKRLKKPYRITSVYREVTKAQEEVAKLIMKEFSK